MKEERKGGGVRVCLRPRNAIKRPKISDPALTHATIPVARHGYLTSIHTSTGDYFAVVLLVLARLVKAYSVDFFKEYA